MRRGLCLSFLGLALLGGCDDDDDTGAQGGNDTGPTADGALGDAAGGDAALGDVAPGDAAPQADMGPDANGCHAVVEPGADAVTRLQTELIEASAGDTVCLGAGTFELDAEISVAVDGLTLRGAGAEQTILDFSGQTVGANGVLLTGDGITVEDLMVRDAAGDGIRAAGVDGITFRRVHVLWTTPAQSDNGAYGLYPVESSNVLVEDCRVEGASDAGIYVGQSRNILVRGNEATGNVAGIEIENSTDAEVVDNHVFGNTGGILVFTLPQLPMKDGARCKVHQNRIIENNLPNFGRAGSIVSLVPGGTGAFILAADDTEFTGNEVRGNETTGLVIISYLTDILGNYDDDAYDPYSEGSWVHDNTFADNGDMPQGLLGGLGLEVPLPDILSDGCQAEGQAMDPARRTCIRENGATFRDIDLCGDMTASDDLAPYDCEHDAQSTIDL